MRRLRTFTGVLLVSLALAAPAAASQNWGLQGGKTLAVGDDAVSTWFGFPSLGVAFHTPIGSHFQVAPKFELEYGRANDVEAPVVSFLFGAELKWTFFEKNKLALALVVDPALRLTVHDDDIDDYFGFSMRFGPRVQGSYGIASNANALFRAGMPFEMLFYGAVDGNSLDQFILAWPIAFGGGVEFGVTSDINVFFVTDLGPTIVYADSKFGDDTDVEFYYRGELGVQFRF